MLAGHYDTVPAQDNLPGRIAEGAVHGCGASATTAMLSTQRVPPSSGRATLVTKDGTRLPYLLTINRITTSTREYLAGAGQT